MKVRFWGTKGSLPGSIDSDHIREKIRAALQAASGQSFDTPVELEAFIDTLPFSVRGTYGTSTTCFQIMNPNGPYMICDCGSGLRDLGNWLMKTGRGTVPSTYHIFMSHLHWDHIQGFPFFVPAYIPGNEIIIHSYHEPVEAAFVEQMDSPCFPVPFTTMSANITFDVQQPLTPFAIDGFQITAIEQNHPGISYGYRFEKAGKIVVFSSDSEHKKDAFQSNYRFLEFFRDADLLVFDAQYSMADATFTKSDWGHSSNVLGVELAARSNVKRLALTHHEPTSTDTQIDDFSQSTYLYREIYHQEAQMELGHDEFPHTIVFAHDGLEMEV